MAKERFIGTAEGYGGDVTAEIEVENGSVTSLRLTGENETGNIGGEALIELEKTIPENGYVYTDAVSGATITSAAARDALQKAKIAAGLAESEDRSGLVRLETELLICGCGVSGIACGLSAGERGVKVLMVDRTEVFGGNGLWANGGYFVETEQQKAAGVNYTVREAYEEAEYYAGYLNDPILMRMVLGESAETVRWCNSYGAGFYLLPYQKMLAHEGKKPLCYHCWDGQDPIGHFKAALEGMENVDILYHVKIESLIQDESGRVIGARGTGKDGQPYEIAAKAVYIGTGGYIADREMIKRAVGERVAKVLIADSPEVSDGSGIKMAWAAGGGHRGDKLLGTHGGRTGLGEGMEGLPGCDLLMNLPILWVNRKGRRFMNEETIYESLFYSNLLLSQGGYAYIVFDRASIEQWMAKTIPLKMHFWDRFGENGGYYCPAVKTFEKDFETAKAGHMGFCADSIEELAAQLGMDPKVLRKTVDAYNGFVETGVDTEFFKSAESLKYPVKDGPFYALQCNLQAQGTTGGIRVSDRLEVIDDDELEPIPGLYAGGSDAGGLFADSYTVLNGMGISWALTSGRIAGKSAAEYIRSL